MGLSSFQGIEIIIIVKWQLREREREREAWNGKTGARVGNIQRYQEAGFRGKFVPSPLNFPIRSRIGTSRRINIDNLSRRATRLALLVH